jgi:uncharacterized protein YeaO (DUF488 family)
MLQLKSVYDPSSVEDGYRVLVDRFWPGGLKRELAHIDLWLKDIAPSDELRRWFGHDPVRWTEFKARYIKELAVHEPLWREILVLSRRPSDAALCCDGHTAQHRRGAQGLS